MSRCGSLGTAQLAVAQADPAAAKRDPVELPFRFHGELFGRAERRKRSDAMSERSCRGPLAVKAVMPATAPKPPAPPVTAAPAAPAP